MRVSSTFLLLGLLFPGAAALAQVPTAATATLSGTVTDPTGALVPGAAVELVDTGTNSVRTAETGKAGHYAFVNVLPGVYRVTVTMSGFKQATVPTLKIEVGKAYTLDFTLQVGSLAERVEVTADVGVELQKSDATIGSGLTGEALLRMPNVTRDLYQVQLIQPLAMPWRGSDGTTSSAGQIAGARTDQHTYLLDGADVSANLLGFAVARPGIRLQASLPFPLESVEEFRVAATNFNATFGRSSGAQFIVVTKRGTNAFHGSAYWYHQNDNLNANTWTRNRAGKDPVTGKDRIPEPELKDNRFGVSLGGPIRKNRTFFFANYEGRRFPQATDLFRLVPTGTLRAGILRFRDADGNIISYDITAFDPRGIGLNPVITSLWNLLPSGNNLGRGDSLNVVGFDFAGDNSIQSDSAVLRLDHNFNDRWRFDGSYRYQGASEMFPLQVDIAGVLPGNVVGRPVTVGRQPIHPRHVVGGVTGQISPRLTNEFRVSWVRDFNSLRALIPFPQVPGTNAGLDLAGDLVDDPGDFGVGKPDPGSNLTKMYQVIDNITWARGKHALLFGGTYRHFLFFQHRTTKTFPPLTSLLAAVDAGAFVSIPSAFRPPTCGGGVTANCLVPGDVTRWNRLYAAMLGLIDNVGVTLVRDRDLNPLPIGSEIIRQNTHSAYELYFNDTWSVNSALTLSLGVSYQVQTPPEEKEGRQTFFTDNNTGEILSSDVYLARVRSAALKGEIYNPPLGFVPVSFFGRKSVLNTDWSNLGPRLAAAWSPSFKGGFLGQLFGDRKTVLRGGYSLVFDRLNEVVGHIPAGVGFAQVINSSGPKCDVQGTPGQACDPTGSSPVSAFRVGVDGLGPIPTIPTVTVPIVPGVPFEEFLSFDVDPNLRVGRSHTIDFTIQRELPWEMLMEIGWVGRFSRQLIQNYNLSSVPYFHLDVASGQSFAQAFDLVAEQLRAGVTPGAVTPQPWFENQAGAGRTVSFATNFAGAFIDGSLNSLWNALQSSLPSPITNRQVFELSVKGDGGRAYYSGAFITLRKRYSQGLTFDLNYTISMALDQVGVTQGSLSNVFSSSFFPDIDYGPSFFDRRHVFNGNWFYTLPFGRGRRFATAGSGVADKLWGGWYVSGIFTANSGLPLTVCQNPFVYGGDQFGLGVCTGAIPLRKPNFGNSVHRNVAGSGGVGTAGNPAAGGSGLNLFADPEAVLKSFRRIRISEDTRAGRGVLRGLPRWNIDLSLGKRTPVTETVQIVFTFDFLNLPNRLEFVNPTLDLRRPTTFGVLTSQGNSPRAIQFGFRVEF